MPAPFTYTPRPWLRSPHLQTVLSSRGIRARGRAALARSEAITLECRDGTRLAALVDAPHPSASLLILLHGWLGTANSAYLERTAVALLEDGFNVARLLLRDHGDTASLNVEPFNAARIDEVVDACNQLAERHGQRAGLVGFSLGGNFALRVASHPDRSDRIRACFAVCPAIDPAAAVDAIDGGWFGYRLYFVRKWHRAFKAKQAAFPERFDFTEALALDHIAALTDWFVPRYTPFTDAADYYAHYRLNDGARRPPEIATSILVSADDPVIPIASVDSLPSDWQRLVTVTRHGGHCAFLETATDTFLARCVPRFFRAHLR
jgi:predicted alpha/beta-fold hydrolase